jgi:RNA polymerase sigma-70 factor (ECF subfamily)
VEHPLHVTDQSIAGRPEAPADDDAMDGGTQRFLAFARSDDRSGMEELLREYHERCVSRARSILGNAADAEDAVQDAFLRLVRGASSYDGSVPFGAWLARLVTEASLDLRRSATRRRRREDEALLTPPTQELESAEDERLAQLRQLVAELPDELKAPIELRFFAGLSQKETAEKLGVSENLVAVRIHRGKERLRRRLAQGGVILTLPALDAHLASAGHGGGGAAALVGAKSTAHSKLWWGMAAALLAFLSAPPVWLALRPPRSAAAAAIPAQASPVAAAPAAPATSKRVAAKKKFYAWNFDDGEAPELKVLKGSWHHLDHGGVGDSGCMEIDGDVCYVVVDAPLLDGPLKFSHMEGPLLPATIDYQATLIWSNAPYQYIVYNFGAPPKNLDLRPGRPQAGKFYPIWQYIDEDSIQVWSGIGRTITEFVRRLDQSPLVIQIGGHQRLDDLRIEQIDAAEVPDLSELRRAVYSVPLGQRHGEGDLKGMRGYDRRKPVRVNWQEPIGDQPLIAP